MPWAQWCILALGGLGVWLASEDRDPRRQRWGWLLGLAAQPFWIYESWNHELWGIFALSIFYTFAWARGAWRRWLF